MHSLLDLKLANSIDDDRRKAAAVQGQRSARRARAARELHRPNA